MKPELQRVSFSSGELQSEPQCVSVFRGGLKPELQCVLFSSGEPQLSHSVSLFSEVG